MKTAATTIIPFSFSFIFWGGKLPSDMKTAPTIIIPFHFFGGDTSLSHGRDDLQRSDFDIRIICRILVSCKISVSCNNLSDYLFLQNSAFSKSKSGKVWLFLLNILSLDLTDQDWLMKDKEYLYRPGGRSLNIFHYNIWKTNNKITTLNCFFARLFWSDELMAMVMDVKNKG